MKRSSKTLTAILVMVLLALGLAGCGTGQLDGSGDGAAAQPDTVFTKTGAIATDSWGYTGATPVAVAAPSQAQVTLKEHTMLEGVLDNGMKVVVSGISFTTVSYSADITTLPAAAQVSAPAHFASYLNLAVGVARTTLPAFSVTVDAAGIAAGDTVTVYNYDPGTRRWINPQTVSVSGSGKISFQASDFGIYGVFRP
jgi:hypothetical protein